MKRMTGPFELKIEKLVYGGEGLGRHAGKVVFVQFSAPGDRLLVRPIEEKKNFIRAAALEVLEPGPGRQPAPCAHFQSCGGCQWQHLEYRRQVDFKRLILEDLFHHHFPETRSLLINMRASPQQYGYRSRARLHVHGFGEKRRVGFLRFQSHTIEDIETCPLLRPVLNQALGAIRLKRLKGEGDQAGRLDVACSAETGVWGATEVQSGLEGISALSDGGGQAAEEEILERQVGEFVYSLTPSVFFQTNDFMIGQLVEKVEELTERSGRGAALDLFCGVGLFSLPLARRFEKVAAVESSPAAARFCKVNAAAAGLSNLQVSCADVVAWMKTVGSLTAPRYDLVVLDPPRVGADSEVMNRIAEWAPENVLYVSCDPQTLCRDLALLVPRHYKIDHIEGMDLFPQTYHFETIVRLRRR